jgi:enoyl-CoA hydratase/carnithine racemase
MGEFCRVEREGQLTIVTITRPQVMNALHPPACAELSQVFDDFEADPEQWVAILTGEGDRAFSAGNDLKYQAQGSRLVWPPAGFGGITNRFQMEKPVIAAVNGLALGGGCEMVLACDLAVAAETASLGLPEPLVGQLALGGGLHRIPRQIPSKHAMGMLLTGRRVPAREALAMGLLNEVVPEGQALEGARRWAQMILACAPLSVRASKRVALDTLSHPTLEAANEASYDAVRAALKSADFIEGPRAFAEKRKPRWQGQ